MLLACDWYAELLSLSSYVTFVDIKRINNSEYAYIFAGGVVTPAFTRISRRLSLSTSRIFSDFHKPGKIIRQYTNYPATFISINI